MVFRFVYPYNMFLHVVKAPSLIQIESTNSALLSFLCIHRMYVLSYRSMGL